MPSSRSYKYINYNSHTTSDYVKRFATEEALRETEKHDHSSDDESSMSDFSDDDMAKEMELWFQSFKRTFQITLKIIVC